MHKSFIYNSTINSTYLERLSSNPDTSKLNFTILQGTLILDITHTNDPSETLIKHLKTLN
jgi:hypothetical protein